jgi:hypothetical protein
MNVNYQVSKSCTKLNTHSIHVQLLEIQHFQFLTLSLQVHVIVGLIGLSTEAFVVLFYISQLR